MKTTWNKDRWKNKIKTTWNKGKYKSMGTEAWDLSQLSVELWNFYITQEELFMQALVGC